MSPEKNMIINQHHLNAAFESQPIRHRAECLGIVKYVKEEMGLDMTVQQAQELWDQWSAWNCASWLIVREEEIREAVEEFVRRRLSYWAAPRHSADQGRQEGAKP